MKLIKIIISKYKYMTRYSICRFSEKFFSIFIFKGIFIDRICVICNTGSQKNCFNVLKLNIYHERSDRKF